MDKSNSSEDDLSPEEKILSGWWQAIQSGDEEEEDRYLNGVVSSEGRIIDRQADSSNHQPIFYPDTISACLLSFSSGMLGHSELTKSVFGSNGRWSENAITNFARASTYPDLLFFDDMKYHAQSVSDARGTLHSPNGKEDLIGFTVFLQEQLCHLDISINDRSLENVVFYTGVLFHAVQDLCCHQGMSNPEHAFLNKNGRSPDKDPHRYDFALIVNNSFAESNLWKRLNQIKDDLNSMPTVSWKEFLTLKRIVRLSRGAVKFSCSAPRTLSTSNHARWFLWQCKDDNEEAFSEIKDKIFSKLK